MCVVYEQPREHFHSIFEMNIVWFLDYFARGLRMEIKCAFNYISVLFFFTFIHSLNLLNFKYARVNPNGTDDIISLLCLFQSKHISFFQSKLEADIDSMRSI